MSSRAPAHDSPETPVPLAEAIRTAILSGEYVPDQRLVEAELCARFGVSRGAVRTALAELAHDRLVERIANRGARVRAVGVPEAVAITEVRMALEGLCTAKAAEVISDDQVTELRAIGKAMQDAVAGGDVITYSQLNKTLHDRLREISDQPVAADILLRLRAQNVRHQFRLALRPGRPQTSLPEHLAIIDEVCARNPESAERAMRRHLLSVIEALRASPSAELSSG